MPSPLQHRLLIVPLAAALLGAAVFASLRPRFEPQPVSAADDSPEACVGRLLAAEERGDSAAYLDCFILPQREKLAALWRGRSPSQIAAELRDQSAGMVGRALTELSLADPDHARLVLERIGKDHTRRQEVSLSRERGTWRIAELAAADWQTPPIPYGTPVFTRQ